MLDRIISSITGDTVLGVGDFVESQPGVGQPMIRGEVVAIERDLAVIEIKPGLVRRRSVRNLYLIPEEACR